MQQKQACLWSHPQHVTFKDSNMFFNMLPGQGIAHHSLNEAHSSRRDATKYQVENNVCPRIPPKYISLTNLWPSLYVLWSFSTHINSPQWGVTQSYLKQAKVAISWWPFQTSLFHRQTLVSCLSIFWSTVAGAIQQITFGSDGPCLDTNYVECVTFSWTMKPNTPSRDQEIYSSQV